MSKTKLTDDQILDYAKTSVANGIQVTSHFVQWFRKEKNLKAGEDRLRKIFNDYFSSIESQGIQQEVENRLSRDVIIRRDRDSMSTFDQYRMDEIYDISKELNTYFNLKFEVDHAQALLNLENPGKHIPDNLHILIERRNRIKSNNNWDRYSIDKQIEHIRHHVEDHLAEGELLGVSGNSWILDALIERLKLVYEKEEY